MSSVPGGKSQAGLVDDMQTHADDPILNQATVAAVLGVHKSTVHRWLDSGAIRAVKNPKGILKVRKSDILNFVRSSKWSSNEEIQKQLDTIEERDEDHRVVAVEQVEQVEQVDTNTIEGAIDDGNKTMVGDSSSGQANRDDHNRRNRRDK